MELAEDDLEQIIKRILKIKIIKLIMLIIIEC